MKISKHDFEMTVDSKGPPGEASPLLHQKDLMSFKISHALSKFLMPFKISLKLFLKWLGYGLKTYAQIKACASNFACNMVIGETNVIC